MGCRCFDAGDFQTTDDGSAAVDHDVSEWALSELGLVGFRGDVWDYGLVVGLHGLPRGGVGWLPALGTVLGGCSSLNGDSMGVRCVGGATSVYIRGRSEKECWLPMGACVRFALLGIESC